MEAVRFKAIHPNAYKPEMCTIGILGSILWDDIRDRLVVSLIYDNGYSDVIPLSELYRKDDPNTPYRITNGGR